MRYPILLVALVLVLCPSVASARTLKPGSTGEQVRSLQYKLMKRTYLPKVTGRYDDRTRSAVLAFQSRAGLARDGVAGERTQRKLATSGTPRPRSTRGKHVEVSISSQTLLLVNKGRVIRTLPVSTGRAGFGTPTGSFRIQRKIVDEYSRTYGNAPMPYASYFVGGVAFHGGQIPGYPASHGCVRVPMESMRSVYSWTPIGTRVVVY